MLSLFLTWSFAIFIRLPAEVLGRLLLKSEAQIHSGSVFAAVGLDWLSYWLSDWSEGCGKLNEQTQQKEQGAAQH